MTIQDKKDWLKSYLGLMQEYKALLEERGKWVDTATRITPIYSDTPKGGSEDKIQRSVDKLADIDAHIFEQLEQIERQRAEIVNAISRLEDSRYRAILLCRYINGKTFEEIAESMNYSYRQTTRLHGEALVALEV